MCMFYNFFIHAYVACPLPFCKGIDADTYYLAFFAFLTILPLGVLLIVVARFTKRCSNFIDRNDENGSPD